MKKTTKGALAAVAGGSLLFGGAGSLAYWNGTTTVDGAEINAGDLSLTAPDCTTLPGSHEWQFDGTTPVTSYTTGSTIVPGDTLTKVCDATLVLEGDHIGATMGIDLPTFDASSNVALATALGATTATFAVTDADEDPVALPVAQAGTYNVRVTITVPFDPAADNATIAVDAELENIAVTATQTHDIDPDA